MTVYSVYVQNVKGDVIQLTQNESDYQVISITGLNPPSAQINTTAAAGLDGASFNSARLNTRNIVITVKINGDVESNRQHLYKFFPTKQWVEFFYTNANLNVFIEGYVQNVECDLFSNSERMQISIICPQPYFKGVNEIIEDISNTVALFVFPFSINRNEPIPFSEYLSTRITNVFNDSDSESGVTIHVTFSGSVSTLVIRNTDNGDTFTLNYAFQDGDQVTINTNKGQKSVTLLRNGATSNIFSAVKKGSVFFELAVGDNNFGYQADSGASDDSVKIEIAHRTLYRGV